MDTDYTSSPVKTQIRAMEIRCAPPKPSRKSMTLGANTHYTTEAPGSNLTFNKVTSTDKNAKNNVVTHPGRQQSRYIDSKEVIKLSEKSNDVEYSDIEDDDNEKGERDSNYEIPMYNGDYHSTYIARDGRKMRQRRERRSFIARKMKCELDFNSQTIFRTCIVVCVLLLLLIVTFIIYGVVMKRACPLPLPPDCAELLRRDPLTPSGVYFIRPRVLNEDVKVYCDMETTGGGWTVIQRRKDGSQNFGRDWFEYKQGFGDVSSEFWLGNEKIHFLTLQGHYELRIDMEDVSKKTSFVEYSYFWLGSETNFYRLYYDKFLGGVGATDRLSIHRENAFSTMDRDHDLAPSLNCAKFHHGGWWYHQCKDSNLNGNYFKSGMATADDGVTWENIMINGTIKSLTFTEMKVRPDIF
ncbi:ficolin-2-like [Antedon mediterranea]|uniref:ficolin-2-like n=1 Tax=Antedon mediterranea TaxID=105859 RepID=UPI003AF57B79